ncbi:hydrogenase maturation nickel metallochaperone HypA [Endothiovibrio diazotrophicus]
MHEMSLCEGVVRVAETTARDGGFRRVEGVWLEVGALAGVDCAALRLCFAAATRGSLAEGARLEIVERPGEAWCLACADTVALNERFGACPDCGGYQLQVTGGDQLRVVELEVE